ncbi:MAG: aminopeptidase [Candidatus Wallbacteria bacterium]
MQSILEKYALLITTHSLKLKKGDRLLITSTYLAEPLLKEIYKQALIKGANTDFRITFNESAKIFYDNASTEQLQYISPFYKHAVDNFEALLTINAPFNLKELQYTDPEKKKIVNSASADISKTFMRRSFEGSLRWGYCEYPTDAGAQEAGMSKSEYENFVYSACFLYDDDPISRWQEVRQRQQKLVDFLNTKNTIRFKNNSSDISFGVKNRIWINSCGDANMPSGEVFTAPIEDSVNGKIRFSYPAIFMGQEIEDITLEIKNGEVISWNALKGKELLDKIFEIPGAKRFGEAAIGTNYGIKKFIKNMLFDEKIGGTVHMALGSAYPHTLGKNTSSIHLDLLADMKSGGEIYADNELIYKDGNFII